MSSKLYFTFLAIGLSAVNTNVIFSKSISQNSEFYPKFCQAAAKDDAVFKTFRRDPAIRAIIETCWDKLSGAYFLNEIETKYPQLLPYLRQICEEDIIGSPIAFDYPPYGTISPIVLRYVKIVGDLQREFGDLSKLNIAEIGGGFGGQCKIINNIGSFASYTIIDLPECTPLINKYLASFAIKNLKTINSNVLTTPIQCDLIISNFAFSELDQSEQLHYMQMVINSAKRGYIIYNNLPIINPFTSAEFVKLLRRNSTKNIIVLHEQAPYSGDVIIWK